MSKCDICFLDCMGYWDMASQIISLFILITVIAKTVINICNLLSLTDSTPDPQLTKSHKRKLMINLLSSIYQLSLLVTISFSLIIFLIYKQNIHQVGENKLNLWYKWCEIIFINLLNCLNLTVGLLYWKAVRLYYKLSEQHIPTIYSSYVKMVFAIFYVINFAIVIISLIMLLDTKQVKYEQNEIKIINMVNSLGVGCSTVVCLLSRVLYQQKILNPMTVNKLALKKQTLYSILIASSGICRLVCMVLNLVGIDYSTLMRNFDNDCIDQTPYHAIVIFIVTILINIVPSIIFSIIFSPTIESQKTYHEINDYLCKKDQSAIYV